MAYTFTIEFTGICDANNHFNCDVHIQSGPTLKFTYSKNELLKPDISTEEAREMLPIIIRSLIFENNLQNATMLQLKNAIEAHTFKI